MEALPNILNNLILPREKLVKKLGFEIEICGEDYQLVYSIVLYNKSQ